MKKLFALAGVVILSGSVYALVTPSNTDHVDYCTGANNSNCVYKVDSSGNVTGKNITAQGNLSVTGTSTVTGVQTFTAAPVFSTYASLASKTTTQISVLVAPAGSIVFCSTINSICLSTAAVAGSFVVGQSTGTVCK